MDKKYFNKRIYLSNHEPINFTFKQNRYDFVVDEIPLKPYEKNKKGKYLILHIKKVFNTTWDLIDHIENVLDIRPNEIGYAGLKDKNATTTQYISIPVRYEKDIDKINTKNIQILETYKSNEKLKIGDLLGNAFAININDLQQEDLPTIYQVISKIQKHGMPNYFGFQRFGTDGNFEQAKDVVYGEEIIKDHKLKRMMISAYQSHFFNAWLSKRIETSLKNNQNRLELLEGDIIYEYNTEKIFAPKTLDSFSLKQYCPTGLLPGRKVARATKNARGIEEQFDDEYIHDKGYRRPAWIYPKNISNKYDAQNKVLQLKFELPKSSYATIFIENLANRIIKTK